MAEFARDASSSDGLCATLETYVYSSDAEENEQDEPMGEERAERARSRSPRVQERGKSAPSESKQG